MNQADGTLSTPLARRAARGSLWAMLGVGPRGLSATTRVAGAARSGKAARSATVADLEGIRLDNDLAWRLVKKGITSKAVRSATVADLEGIRLDNDLAWRLVKKGITSKAIGPLGDYLGLGKGTLASYLDIDRSTASRRAAKDQPLPMHAAEGVVRLLEIDQLACDTFETEDDASRWLRRPHPMLDGESPLEAARTGYGTQRVRDILLAIQHGGVV